MYVPQQFAVHSTEELNRIVQENPLGMLVTNTATGLEANHLPFLLQGNTLLAHVARANPIWRDIQSGSDVLVVFRGAQGYISPNWYPGKQETHQCVPTWNYEVVHAHGTIHIRDNAKFIRKVVALLTRQHEADQPQPWRMGDAPAEYIDEQLRHIVGIEILIDRLEGKRKLNQHHQEQDRVGAIQGLESQGNLGLAKAMRDSKPHSL